jgi:hypothetical protein
MIDGKAAALAVRAHFEDVHGALSVLGFQLIDIKKNEGENCWEVSCLFYPGLGARAQNEYRVKVDSEDGSILDQEKIEKE